MVCYGGHPSHWRFFIMAKATYSEKMVSLSNKEYANKKIALIKKLDARVRSENGRVSYVSSTGLDYVGVLKNGGKFISFEVKETERDVFPIGNISSVQLERIKHLEEFNAEVFLLVYFSTLKEWYILYHSEIEQVLNLNPTVIPVRYFRAFGFSVPSENGIPDYLNPDRIFGYAELRKDYPSWIRTRIEKPLEQIKTDRSIYLNPEERMKRIQKAFFRGCENAVSRQQRIDGYKRNK